MKKLASLAAVALIANPVIADPAEIVSVIARDTGNGWTFDVTLLHGDTGWEDYADGWRVETGSGDVLGTRTLFHPHVNEQPFTRSLSGVSIPDGTERVAVRARTLPDGWADETTSVDLPN